MASIHNEEPYSCSISNQQMYPGLIGTLLTGSSFYHTPFKTTSTRVLCSQHTSLLFGVWVCQDSMPPYLAVWSFMKLTDFSPMTDQVSLWCCSSSVSFVPQFREPPLFINLFHWFLTFPVTMTLPVNQKISLGDSQIELSMVVLCTGEKGRSVMHGIMGKSLCIRWFSEKLETSTPAGMEACASHDLFPCLGIPHCYVFAVLTNRFIASPGVQIPSISLFFLRLCMYFDPFS